MNGNERNSSQRIQRPMDIEEIADAHAQFTGCDVDGDQRINFAEFSGLLERVGFEVTAEQRRHRFEAIDSNRDGAIDRHEFVEWLRHA